ncbi:helix-turn-helix transcriptional regulator [Paenibacillus sp. HN-1]|uniref:AraC family transcriptional regulator n=1 Tax=Paenibacillus TaxID=44249 RepID=UPI001CA99035|nr:MULTISPECIES: AraC family transcriptional regulator [Paenibacillus]MBY9081294.1 helix-turn-helix transcriptional regulator [Paenibacillus sp. CGMCC 1.18879]MBY9087567.1 helix-turn-helix transcriptional regulator [Paenibacillus sinensis]
MQIKQFGIGEDLRELTEHHTSLLPMACYQTEIRSHVQGYVPLHWHEEVQFVLVMKGEAVFQINEHSAAVTEGEALFINSGSLHKAEDQKDSGCVYICLDASPRYLVPQELYGSCVLPFITATNLTYYRIVGREAWETAIREAIMDIHRLISRKPSFYELQASCRLTEIWRNLIMNGLEPEYDQAEQQKNDRMKEMLDWIHVHYADKVTLEAIAAAGALSRSECCRYFKRMLKTTPMNYVTDYRLQKSKLLLLQSDLSVTEVAYLNGFSSTSYFIERFRQSVKATPLAYRKRAKAE